MQHCILNAFRKFLVHSPVTLEVFRDEGIWDLIFSENFFFFGPASGDFSEECCSNIEEHSTSNSTNDQIKSGGIEILQMEVISFVEFAATSNRIVHNLVGYFFYMIIILLDIRFSACFICFFLC